MASPRWYRTRPTALVAGALVAVVLAGGLAGAAAVNRPSAPAPGETAVDGKLAPSQLSSDQVAEEPEVTAPAPAPAAAGSAGSTAAPAPPLPGHRTPGAVVTPFRAGRTEWSGVSNGISLRLVMSPASPRSGETVTFAVEASMPGGLCCGLLLQFGDGREGAYPPPPALGDRYECAAREPKSDSVRGEVRHVYNKPGRWNFSLGARSGLVCGPSEVVYGSLDGTLEIGGGASAPTAQGPARPAVKPASSHPYERYVINLVAEVRDDDGYIARIVVDWGDGSALETYRNPHPCKTTVGGWPASGYTFLPLWMGTGPVKHRYRDDGPYKVTVTAVSTGCDGTSEQRGSGTLTFPEPLPPPPPIESIPLPPVSNIPPPPPIPSLPVPVPSSFPTPTLVTTTTVPR